MMFNWQCKRFERLIDDDERNLNARKLAFLERHRKACAACRLTESQGALALSMLRNSAVEVTVSPSFDERVIRKLRVTRTHESLRFWSPAFIGAAVAAVAVLAGLQIVVNSSNLPALKRATGSEARRMDHSPVFPEISRTVEPPRVR